MKVSQIISPGPLYTIPYSMKCIILYICNICMYNTVDAMVGLVSQPVRDTDKQITGMNKNKCNEISEMRMSNECNGRTDCGWK